MQRLACPARLLAATALVSLPSLAGAVDLEVTHWWTSGGEAAAVQALAAAYDAVSENTWVDGAIAGSSGTAVPIIISRIIGGDPMAATQLNHGQDARELIEAGLMLDLTEVAEANNWREVINPPSLLDACTYDGRIYCAPLNIHSIQWMWTSRAAFEAAGVEPVSSLTELKEVAPALRAAGIQPLISGQAGWQLGIVATAMMTSIPGKDLYNKIFEERDEAAIRGPEMVATWEALVVAREMIAGSTVNDWNLATAEVIEGRAAAQIMGDWAQGEFAVAGQVAGEDYDCLIGLGAEPVISVGGDSFYFPVNDDPAITAAQLELAQVIVSPEAQVAFNTLKGSLPVRGDVSLEDVNECTRAGLQTLADGNIVLSLDILLDPNTIGKMDDLFVQFFASDMTAADAHAQFADILLAAD